MSGFFRIISLAAVLVFAWPFHAARAENAAASGAASPFAATGLLTRPDEPAEEILLRAHQGDSRAMLLVVVGYQRGLGGFPKAPSLSSFWTVSLSKLASPEAFSLAWLLVADSPPEERLGDSAPEGLLGARLAHCDAIEEKAGLSEALRKAGLYDARAVCNSLEASKNSRPGWEETYAATRRIRDLQQASQQAMRAMREFRVRTASAKDVKALRALMGEPADLVLDDEPVMALFAATSYDPAFEPPDWRAANLLAFLDAQALWNRSGPLESDLFFLHGITGHIVTELRQKLPPAPAGVIGVIRKAHQEEPEAILAMARHYEEGNSDFVKNPALSLGWLAHGAYRGDSRCQVLMALRARLMHRPELARCWAAIARDDPRGTLRLEAGKLAALLDSILTEGQRDAAEKLLPTIRSDMRKHMDRAAQ